MKDLISISIIAILLAYSLHQCDNINALQNDYQNNIDSLKFYKFKKANIKESIIHINDKSLKKEAKNFSEVKSITKIKTITRIDTVFIPINKVDSTILLDNKNISIAGRFDSLNLIIDSLKIPNKQNIIVGSYKASVFKKSELSVSVENSNPLIQVQSIESHQIKVPKKWYEKPYITIPLGFLICSIVRK